MKNIKKNIIMPLVLTLLLTGCSTKDTNQNEIINNSTNESSNNESSNKDSDEQKNYDTTGIEELGTISYDEIYKRVSDGGHKLESCLNKWGVKYYKSKDNLSLVSSSDSYTAYDQEYTQKFSYGYNLSISEYSDSAIKFKLEKEYHRDDEIDKNDPYFNMFYECAKNYDYDSSLTKDELIKQIDELRLSETDGDTWDLYDRFYITEDEYMKISVNDSKLTLKLNMIQPMTLEELEIPVSEYDTVADFKAKPELYENNNNNYLKRNMLSDSPLKPSIEIGYRNNIDGNLYEVYSFNFAYLADSSKAESENIEDRVSEATMPKEIIDLLPKLVEIIKDHSGVDILNYMSMEQFSAAIQSELTTNAFSVSSNSLPIPGKYVVMANTNLSAGYTGDLSYGEEYFPPVNSITIYVYKDVKAEGKSRL